MGAIALNELIFLFSGPPYREMMYRPSPGPALLDAGTGTDSRR
jgi:hypothetical protein